MREYLIELDILKSSVKYVYSHKYLKVKIVSDGDLPVEKH